MALPDVPAIVTEMKPIEARRIDACERANKTDWAYIGVTSAMLVGATYANLQYFKYGSDEPLVRIAGSGLVGVGWGAAVGGLYRSLPRCSMGPRGLLSPELALQSEDSMSWSLSLGAALTAPLFNIIAMGTIPRHWSTEERAAHVVLPGVLAAATSWLPAWRPLSPRPWRAYDELLQMHVSGDTQGLQIGVHGRF